MKSGVLEKGTMQKQNQKVIEGCFYDYVSSGENKARRVNL